MSVTALCLGLDVSPLRMGWALVRLDDGSPVACGCEALDLPAHGWHHRHARRATENVQRATATVGVGEVAMCWIEQPWLSPKSGTKSAYSAGRAVQAVQGECERRWPHAPIQWLQPSEWREAAGLSGNASKDDVMLRALEIGFGEEAPGDQSRVLSWSIPSGQDAADAVCIAYAGWRINEGIMAHVKAGGRVL